MAALLAAATATAAGNDYKVHTTKDGQLAARAVVLTMLDLGSGWKGGPVKPDLSGDIHCANYHPKSSDLVRTGAAAAKFTQPGMEIRSDSQVLGSARMVRLDWQRSVGSPNYLSCARATIEKATKGKTRIVSVRAIPIPRIGDASAAFRTIFDVKTKNGAVVRVAVDIVAVTQGATEIALTSTLALASVPTLFANELVLAKTLAGRARA